MSDMPDFTEVTHHVARKEHKCYECGGIIEPLDVYERTAGKWDGDFSVFKVCGHCETARDWLLNETDWLEYLDPAGGLDGIQGAQFYFGSLREHLQEQASECDRKYAFRAYRFIVLMDRRRKAAKDKQ